MKLREQYAGITTQRDVHYMHSVIRQSHLQIDLRNAIKYA